MTLRPNHPSGPAAAGRRALLAISSILIAIVVAPLLGSAAPKPSSSGAGSPISHAARLQSPQAAYNLQGDAINPTGSSFSEFGTTAGDTICSWCFFVNNGTTVTGATTLQALGAASDSPNNYSTSTIAIRGRANRVGVQGVQEAAPGTFNAFGTTELAGVSGYSNDNYGVYGESKNGIAMKAVGKTYGIRASGDNVGVYGESAAGGSGVTGVGGSSGVSGVGDDSGVYGNSASGNGILGYSSGNDGVYGYGGNVPGNAGVVGTNFYDTTVYGVRGFVTSSKQASAGGYFTATSGSGVVGTSNTRYGVNGNSTSGYGVYGTANTGAGVYGSGGNGYGIYGSSVSGIGLRGTSVSNIGIYASTTSGNTALRASNASMAGNVYAGYFDGNVRINGNYVATGTKSAAVPTNQGDRLMYSEEATRNLFSDQGSAALKDGRAVIRIDPLFAQTVSLGEGYQVFLTPGSLQTAGLAVINKTATSFEVGELNGGKGSFSFDWRISAPRKGYEKERMAPAPPQIPLTDMPDLPADPASK